MIVGMTSVSKARQTGHCRSMYWTIVTGAFGEPSTFPCCGIPSKVLSAESASGSALAGVVLGVEDDDERPSSANAATAATAATAIATATTASTFGEAVRPPVLRTGGRATA